MPVTLATPNIMKDAGYLLWAPLSSTLPTNTVVGSKFTDTWPAAWKNLGGTDDGSKFAYQMKLEAIKVAEFFDPITWAPTDRTGSFAFALADFTLTNMYRAFNGGTQTVVSGSGTTQLNKLDPPDNTGIIHAMLGWESLDATMRLVSYQTINGGQIEMAFKRAPDNAVIACEFNFEVPSGGVPFSFWSAGTARA